MMTVNQKRPNILIIHADQHRCDCLGAYGNTDIHTPNIDALAIDGRRYTNSFCPYPVCTPSRYSFLSGQYVRQHGGWTNHCTLSPTIPTFPKVLREAGYRTSAVGKMHFTPTYLDVGFQEMILAEQDGPGRYDDDYHRWLMRQGLCDRLDLTDQVRVYRQKAPRTYWETLGALTSDLDEDHHSTTWIAERAMDAITAWQDGGNLLMVGFIKPHHPFDPPASWHARYDPDDLTLLPGWIDQPIQRDLDRSAGYFPHASISESQLRHVMAYYYATISQIDYHVGRLVNQLKIQGLYDDTLILYTSDHGDYMGFHHLLLKGNYMYDPLMRVPLIIKFPHQNMAGTTSDHLCNNLDVAPTLLRATGCDVPATMQGLDLGDPQSGRDVIFADGWAGNEIMVRTRTHKLLHCADPANSQLFDLEEDPLEMQNRIEDVSLQSHLLLLREEMMRWALYQTRTYAYVDDQAPVIRADNVPANDDDHRQYAKEYFHNSMEHETL